MCVCVLTWRDGTLSIELWRWTMRERAAVDDGVPCSGRASSFFPARASFAGRQRSWRVGMQGELVSLGGCGCCGEGWQFRKGGSTGNPLEGGQKSGAGFSSAEGFWAGRIFILGRGEMPASPPPMAWFSEAMRQTFRCHFEQIKGPVLLLGYRSK